MEFACIACYDKATRTLTLRHRKADCTFAIFKLEEGATGTMERVKVGEEADNWWVAIKPSDDVVTKGNLFGGTKLRVRGIQFELDK